MKNMTLQESPLTFSSSLRTRASEREKDNLDLLPYAEVLRDFIQECETPMTIGIQGDWGIGKTSLLNMLRGNDYDPNSGLLMKTRCKVVNFDTWSYSQFNQEEHLALACLYALTNKVSDNITQSESTDAEATSTINNAKKLIGNVLRNIQVDVAGVSLNVADALSDPEATSKQDESLNFIDIAEQMIQFKKQFEELVRLWTKDDEKRRVVIFIDDLDRIKPIRALELLEAIKNFLDVEGCVFVIAVDYEVIQMGMAEKLGKDLQKTSGKSFFDKIIQLPFTMPSDNYKLDDYIMGLLKKAGFPYADKLASEEDCRRYFHDITVCTVGRNPRSIKRVMNYANLLERIRRKYADKSTSSKDSMILYGLICMQIAWSELFSYFAENPNADTINNLENWQFLDTLPEARKLFSRSPDTEILKNNISTFIDTLFEILDENGDGKIDNKELLPVLNVMKLARLTSAEGRERPRDYFSKLVVRNNHGDKNSLEIWFLKKIYRKSIWFLGSEVQYKKSGSRYLTTIINRCQVGTLVSLKSHPFIFRLVATPEKILPNMDATILEKMSRGENDEYGFLRTLSGVEASFTGFGSTSIVLEELWKYTNEGKDNSLVIAIMNDVYRVCASIK